MSRHATHEGSSFRRRFLALAALTAIAACGSENISDWSSDQAEDPEGSALRFMPRPVLRPSQPRANELQPADIRSIQEGAPESYRVSKLTEREFQLSNDVHQFVGKLDPKGMVIAPIDSSWSWSLRTTGMGCDGAVKSLEEPVITAEGNRVRYERPEIEEWYLNGPLGIEQGFVLDKAPECAGPKVIEMKTGGDLHPELVDIDGDGRGQVVSLVQRDGSSRLRVSQLYVNDADGRSVPAWITVKSDTMSIHVDDAWAKYPLTVDPLIGVHQQKVTDPDNGVAAQFGYALALSGNTLIVGAPKANDPPGGGVTKTGTAHVFERDAANVWQFQQRLVPLQVPAQNDRWFGFSIALSGDTALVSAPLDDDLGDMSGAVYVFERSGGVWTQEAKLKANDGKMFDVFGIAVALQGDLALIGAHGCDDKGLESGAAYLFSRTAGTWTQQQKILPNDGASKDLFGATVALSSNIAVVGAVHDNDKGTRSGSVYTFAPNGPVWLQQQKLLASDGAAEDAFGFWAAISGDTIFASSALHDHNGIANSGSVYVFGLGPTGWVEQTELLKPAPGSTNIVVPSPQPPSLPLAVGPRANDYFGSYVALDGNRAVIGAQRAEPAGANIATNSGSAYWYIRSGGVWTARDELRPTFPGVQNENFGWIGAVSGDTVAIGAPFAPDEPYPALPDEPPPPPSPGSAYIFADRKTNGEPCVTDNECASQFCVDGVCCNTACGGDVTDDCQACAKAQGASDDGVCTVLIAKTLCRDALGACDVQEVCNGIDATCPTDVKKTNDIICRSAIDDFCDIAEKCDGVTNDCPADGFAAAGTTCRPGVAGGCDVDEKCSGVSPLCPPDLVAQAGEVCRGEQGICDFAEVCDGVNNACPADFKKPTSFECNASNGECDPVERCDGVSDECPADQKSSAGDNCRLSNGACDPNEVCNGVSDECPPDLKAPIGTLCRLGAPDELCDFPEVCDGQSDVCPQDSVQPANTACRVAELACDVTEFCDGASKKCPDDAIRAAGFDCRPQADGLACDAVEECDGIGKECPLDLPKSAGANCRPFAGLCDEPEECDGKSFNCPVDQKTPKGVICRNLQTDGIGGDGDGACDVQEFCNGESVDCPANKFATPGTLCRFIDGACDVQEVCTGQGPDCPPDAVRAEGALCGDVEPAGVCDLVDTCNGDSKQCADLKVPANIPCRAAGADPDVEAECDVVEFCGGDDPCPEDEWARDGTPCSIGRCLQGICTVDEVSLYGGGPLCNVAAPGSSAPTRWSLGLFAIALGALRRRFRSSSR